MDKNAKLRVITLDLRYTEVTHDLWALGHLMEVIEPTIVRLSDEFDRDRFAKLDRQGEADDAEQDLAYQESHDMREYVLPRFLRGPLLVSIAACLESGIKTVADRRGRELRAARSIRPRPREPFLAAAVRHFDQVLDMPMERDRARLVRLNDLYNVRNAVAHSNGVRERLSTAQWNAVVTTLERHGGAAATLRRGAVVVTRDYAMAAYGDVWATLDDLVTRAKAARP